MNKITILQDSFRSGGAAHIMRVVADAVGYNIPLDQRYLYYIRKLSPLFKKVDQSEILIIGNIHSGQYRLSDVKKAIQCAKQVYVFVHDMYFFSGNPLKHEMNSEWIILNSNKTTFLYLTDSINKLFKQKFNCSSHKTLNLKNTINHNTESHYLIKEQKKTYVYIGKFRDKSKGWRELKSELSFLRKIHSEKVKIIANCSIFKKLIVQCIYNVKVVDLMTPMDFANQIRNNIFISSSNFETFGLTLDAAFNAGAVCYCRQIDTYKERFQLSKKPMHPKVKLYQIIGKKALEREAIWDYFHAIN